MTTETTLQHRDGCMCPACFDPHKVKPARSPEAQQLAKIKMLLAGLLAVVILVAGGAYLLTRPEPGWGFSKCIEASLSGSGYDQADLDAHGCFG